ncbi:hypothetical protein ACIBSW_01800 [Actinoplanes sp. NPDC049668]|uniref:hypothetical protein n=1 Tax=unclassified Actinoplanes TaxID=2626549 RepID=UPI0033B282AA
MVTRTGTSPAGAPALGAEVLHEREFGAGWWSVQLDGDSPGALKGLVAATGAPAVSAFVLDSDCAEVEGLSPAGVSWRTYLHRDTAEGYGAPALEQSDEEITRQALAWSAEAGLAADPGALRDAFEATNVFAEETLDELLAALGIPALEVLEG